MKVTQLEYKAGYKVFDRFAQTLYKEHPLYRATEASTERLLLKHKSAFHQHAHCKMFVIEDGNNIVARFALIDDQRLKDYVQVSFFEALPGYGDLFNLIRSTARAQFPKAKRIVVGLNGHLNYGAGILLNRFDEAPVFGLPYNPDYYADYFASLTMRRMFTYRFNMESYSQWANSYNADRTLKDLNVRFMRKSEIKKESAIYTLLNNQAFTQHPYWADRDVAEDLELMYPFRFLLDDENLIFAELNGKALGFFLWYPDFNQLVSSQRELNAIDVIRYRIRPRIDTFRFTEIGIIPEYQRSPVALALISKSLPVLQAKGYTYCEGGFIFEENRASIAFVSRILERCYGVKPEPYRIFATFETAL